MDARDGAEGRRWLNREMTELVVLAVAVTALGIWTSAETGSWWALVLFVVAGVLVWRGARGYRAWSRQRS